ncbi:MAG: acetyl-CoA decarbonylase/synthase complex subunit delta [Elusimicrobia bacterium RIFOXYC2_FULL_34_12]|nr:MAG: acetyl-CoA decarbonylase/synthase complex subunit delta [Elusimicrobia bacterium RIFOXYC2_FULL_34_12]OGS38102.1 MAG: acetyl-CoA decarbonylase/synthase complex subunit delta [Elusimicrobia bacterium RIFOXYD2_FULL_34_30]HAM38470.1 acetyl-CoA decarbonylase/synthase complex subunit delta [Elusimicrobiota bacterium]
MEHVIEKWPGNVYELTIGATKEDGGTRSRKVKAGGINTLPFLHFEGLTPNQPLIAMEVWDIEPSEWPENLKNEFNEVLNNAAQWAKKCEDLGADLICLRLLSADPDGKNASATEVARTVKDVLSATSIPLMILGCGNNEKDSSIIMDISQIAKGENCLIGMAVKENFKTFTAAAQAGGHSLIAETPLDINLEKQLNILISDMGFGSDRIVIHPSTGGVGYGFEYCYTIIERTRLASLSNDKMMSQPIITFVGQETWKIKECKADETEKPEWGSLKERGVLWEIATASGYLQAGSDILVMNHPKAVNEIKNHINKLMEK